MDKTPEAARSNADYSPEAVAKAVQSIEYAIDTAPSLEAYLLELQVKQNETPEGKAELLRLDRVARTITSPIDSADSPHAAAFFSGSLLSSALLQELNPQRDFYGGTLAHQHLTYHMTKERLARELALPRHTWDLVMQNVCRDIQEEAITWVHHTSLNVQLLRNMTAYLDTLYGEDGNEYYAALAGFWMPLQYAESPPEAAHSEALIDSVDQYFNPVAVNAHQSPEYTPSEERLTEIIGPDISLEPRFIAMDKEKHTLMEAFHTIQDSSFASLTHTLPDQALAAALRQHLEVRLNVYNQEHELFDYEELVHAEGTYYYSIKEAEDAPVIRRMTKGTVLLGVFDSLIIVETPRMQEGKRTAHTIETGTQPRPELKQTPAPALLLRNPVLVTDTSLDQLEDTTIAIPLCYKRLKISTVI